MRFKIFSLFVGIQVISFGLWSTLSHADPSEDSSSEQEHVHVHPVPSGLSASIVTPEVKKSSFHFSVRNMKEEERILHPIKENQLEIFFQSLPKNHVDSLKNIVFDYKADSRGLGGGGVMILRANMPTDEMLAVATHELGHSVHGTFEAEKKRVKSPFKDGIKQLYEGNPMVDFCHISWSLENERKRTATNMDFVSGYAMADCFEDFAESYTQYVLHQNDFKVLAASSPALYEKYMFMKEYVFAGYDFNTGDGDVRLIDRPWDVTALPYANDFLAS